MRRQARRLPRLAAVSVSLLTAVTAGVFTLSPASASPIYPGIPVPFVPPGAPVVPPVAIILTPAEQAAHYLDDRLAWINSPSTNPRAYFNCLRLTSTWINGAQPGDPVGDAVVSYLGHDPSTLFSGAPIVTYNPPFSIPEPVGIFGIKIVSFPGNFVASGNQRYSNSFSKYGVPSGVFGYQPEMDFSPPGTPTKITVTFGPQPQIDSTANGRTTQIPITGANNGVLYGSSDTTSLTTVALVKTTCDAPPR